MKGIPIICAIQPNEESNHHKSNRCGKIHASMGSTQETLQTGFQMSTDS